MILWLACQSPPPEADAVTGDLLVATVASDFGAGTLTSFSTSDEHLEPAFRTTSGDPALAADGDDVFLLQRLGIDTIDVLDSDDPRSVRLSFSTGERSNPQTVVACGGRWLVPLYERTSLPLLSPATGHILAEVDVAAEADADGLPEAASALPLGDDTALVALQRLDRTAGWAPDPVGRVVTVDCATAVVTHVHETGPNPVLLSGPDAVPWVGSETGLSIWTEEGVEPWLDVDALGGIPWRAAVVGGRAVIITRTLDWTWGVACIDGNQVVQGPRNPAFLPSVAAGIDGRAWVAARPGFGVDPGEAGLWPIDPESCEAGAVVPTDLPPYDLISP